MKRVTSMILLAGILALSAAPQSYGHHSFAMFDQTKQVTIEGVVKEFQFTNPHSWIQLTVVPGKGAEPELWLIEALSPNVLMRSGWKRNTLKPGDKISVLINPLRDGKKGGNLILVTLADGTTLGGGAA
ncbi:MAG: DUF6152 family protein [Steroidobacteraceae bacterium]